ncbi:hypothetical protein J8L98_14860 [Pseudoalteromonas sp. MMG013]|uniref:hypothetical protein n=1 Tax=Pseudoalteromonas sp. MMG013 TaxID=2822687 RepID=UPI001B35ED21|nr:hypothetical protein [Pseudoalteromonas sp. MMG013]MBQ4862966.1 hypothetical protein [Pseudoalteromonas sp. MMG013]
MLRLKKWQKQSLINDLEEIVALKLKAETSQKDLKLQIQKCGESTNDGGLNPEIAIATMSHLQGLSQQIVVLDSEVKELEVSAAKKQREISMVEAKAETIFHKTEAFKLQRTQFLEAAIHKEIGQLWSLNKGRGCE